MITRTIKQTNLQVVELKGFEGVTPITETNVITLENVRGNNTEDYRKAIKRKYGADYERKVLTIEMLDEKISTYGIEEDVFFQHAKIISE